jgi:hypothetical protein
MDMDSMVGECNGQLCGSWSMSKGTGVAASIKIVAAPNIAQALETWVVESRFLDVERLRI